MKNKPSSLKIGIGTATILMIFVVLCMVILSVLSLKEAQMNEALAKKEKDYTYAYYVTQLEANSIYDIVIDNTKTNEEKTKEVKEQYKVDVRFEPTQITYTVSINKNKQLYVALQNDNYEITSWIVQTRRNTK